jgi:simple sugar transport system substrate-binding protein
LTESPGSSVLEGRMNSAKEILDEAGVIHSTIDTTTDREKAYSNIESAYTANPEIVGFFSTDTTGTPAAGLFVKNNNLTGKVVVGGFDLNPDTLTGIKEGYIEFTIDQYPYRALHLAMTMLYEKIVLGLEPYTEYMPAGFVDK